MICSLNSNGWVLYPYKDVREFFPALSDWKERKRYNCSSSAMTYTLSANLLAVRVSIYKGDSKDGEQVLFAEVEYKERGEKEWSKWTLNQAFIPQKAEGEGEIDMSLHLESLRENVKDDINHLMGFYGAVFA